MLPVRLGIRAGMVLAAGLLLAAAGSAQTPVWVNNFTGTGNQNEAWAIAFCPDSTVVVTGFSVGADLTRDIVTQKVRRDSGIEVWARRWSGGAGARDEGVAIACDDSGYVFVAGKTYVAATDTDFVTIKYRPNGDTAWVRRYNNGGTDAATEVVPDRRGGCFTIGHSSSAAGNGNQDFYVIHYGPSGAVRWTRRVNGAGFSHDIPTAAVLNAAGQLYVTGFSWAGATAQYDYLTVKYDTTSGDTLWARSYDGTGAAPQSDFAYDITLDDSGYVYVTGRAGEQGTWWDATTIKYRPNGGVVWTNRFDAGWLGQDGGAKVRVDRSFNVFVGGTVQDPIDQMYDFLVFRINQDNTVPWFRTYDGGVEDDDSLTALAVDDGGNVYVTGYTYVYSGDMDWMTIKYSRDGAKIWSAVHQVYGEDDWPFDLVLDEFGELYVTGFDYAGPDEDYATVKYTEDDVGVVRVVLPNDSFRLGATVTPRAWVRNFSALPSAQFATRLEMGSFYYDAQMTIELGPYDSALVSFTPWQVEPTALGSHPVRCYTMLEADKERSNDTAYAQVSGVSVWERLASLPAGPRGKGVKEGGALAFALDSLVYAFKGYNTTEFYVYNALHDSWAVSETIPQVGTGGRKRKVKGGSRLAWDGDSAIYGFKGANSVEFWRFDIAAAKWTQAPDYPATSGRKLRGGTGLAWVPARNSFYSVKGNNTDEFYAFNVDSGAWVAKAVVPPGYAGKKCKDGTAMAFDGDNRIYLLKGGTLEFFEYRIDADSWQQKKDIRYSLYGKKRKMKKGAGAAYDPTFDKFYAMKGYKSGEFWAFDAARDTWVERPADSFPTPPGIKPPYSGSDLCYGAGKLWAMRGNKSLEFWRYNADFPLDPLDGGGGTMASDEWRMANGGLRMTIAPNPFAGRATLRYSLRGPGRVRIVLYDAAGRVAKIVRDGWEPAGERDAALRSDGLAAGVYLARLQVGTAAGTQETVAKLLISR
jgi:hypothetical protein